MMSGYGASPSEQGTDCGAVASHAIFPSNRKADHGCKATSLYGANLRPLHNSIPEVSQSVAADVGARLENTSMLSTGLVGNPQVRHTDAAGLEAGGSDI